MKRKNAPPSLAALAVMSAAVFTAMVPAWAVTPVDASCKLRYPIVLSHNFLVRPLCPPSAPATGPASCVNAEDYNKYCVQKTTDALGQPTCGKWQVPPDEENLPPRNTNPYDPALHRELRAYHRYFSKAIVERLRDTCGNAVYIADKPAYASYEVRARSLRNTVNEALVREHAQKVILVGLSQGAQDARYMTAKLPVDDANPGLGMMTSKVAAVVTLSGEDGGAETAATTLTAISMLNGGNWANYQPALSLVGDVQVSDSLWKRDVAGQSINVLLEGCRGSECNLSAEDKAKSVLHALYDLDTAHMRPSAFQLSPIVDNSHQDLMKYLGVTDARWADIIPPALEANNGVMYFGYGAQIQNWSAAWGDALSQDYLFFASTSLSDGANDGYVSVARQRFANTASNFRNVRTLAGAWWGTGYHHMFFSGRNDKLYAPAPLDREAWPYNGDSASFFQQVARDLKASGF